MHLMMISIIVVKDINEDEFIQIKEYEWLELYRYYFDKNNKKILCLYDNSSQIQAINAITNDKDE